MITYVNSKEAKLFELAAKDLGLESLDVDQYLDKLAELTAISPKYVRLPLYEEGHEDEEIFEIDANARTIKVPASFSRNGVGVVSDELAETVWFKINRYFDIKDFGKAAGVVGDELRDGNLHILIQWEAPDGTKGASWAYAIDVDTDPDFVYFGWALTAEHLTAKAGNIKFAIRIMQYDGDVIAYSFSTQPTQIKVNAGLSFDLTDEGIEIESVADKISSRLMGGQIAHCPVFAEDGNLPPYYLELGAENILSVEASAPEDEEYDAMAYKWYKKGANDADFVQIEGEYTPALSISSSGKYYVVVFGMKEIVDSEEHIYDNGTVTLGKFKYHTSVASSKSIVCEVPAPIAVEIVKDLDDHVVLTSTSNLTPAVERQMIGDEPVGEISLDIKKTTTAEKDLDLETAEFNVVPEWENEKWTYDGTSYDSEAEAKAAADTAQGAEPGEGDYSGIVPVDAVPGVKYLVNADGTIDVDMSKAEEGYYKIVVINELNGDEERTPFGVVCRAINSAATPSVTAILVPSNEESQSSEGSVVLGDKIKAEIEVDGLSDELEVKWFKVVGDIDPDQHEDELLETTVLERDEETGKFFDEYQPIQAGFYYFTAKNKVEETEGLGISEAIKFAD